MPEERRIVVKTELDCWEEPRPVCPYCGYEEKLEELSDMGNQDGLVFDCGQCSEVYQLQVSTKTTYTTAPYEGWHNVKIKKSQESDGGLH